MESYDRLLETLETLLAPGGCAWDREQSVETTARYLIEEAYEFYQAVGEADPAGMVEELGDVLYLASFIGLLAARDGRFDLEDALDSATRKMRRRHPHVFADDGPRLEDAQAVIRNWERIKHGEAERERRSVVDKPLSHALDKVPPQTPPLLRAVRLAEKAAHFHFDWPDIDGVLDKIDEEVAELRAAVAGGDDDCIADELGDALFTLANLGRFLKLDPGLALSRTLEKFRRRLDRLEGELAAAGRRVADCGMDELEQRWQRAKEDDGRD